MNKKTFTKKWKPNKDVLSYKIGDSVLFTEDLDQFENHKLYIQIEKEELIEWLNYQYPATKGNLEIRKKLEHLINSVKKECVKSVESICFFDSYGGSKEFQEAEKYRKQGYNSAKMESIKAIRDEEDKPPKKRGGCDVC